MKVACPKCEHAFRLPPAVDQGACLRCGHVVTAEVLQRWILGRRYCETILGILAISVFTAAVAWVLLSSK
jgi:hypothetical protein